MKLSTHADRSEKQVGIRAEDIHAWIDGFFDAESFNHFLRTGRRHGFNPYSHRKYRHCAEALKDAFREFEGKYTREQIRAVFECHLNDDYDGFIPLQEDFESGMFAEKYHEEDELEKILSEAELSEYFKGKSGRKKRAARMRLSSGFYWRVVWPMVIAGILFASSAFIIIVPVFRNSMMNQKREMIRELAATAVSAVQFYVHQEQSGKLQLEDAQRLAAAEVSELRYGDEQKDYFWITDMHPRMVMHPYRPELIGLDLTHYTDRENRSGKRIFSDAVEMVRDRGEGYLEYLWQWKDDPSRAEPKLSFVRAVPEWGWIIGTGIYIHDVEAEIGKLSRRLLAADGIIAVLLAGLMVSVLVQSRRIEMDRTRAEAGLREAKDRYRALVEGSKEGYLLEVEGETVYSNPTFRQMTGYSEHELIGMRPWEILAADREENRFAEQHLRAIYGHTAVSAEFDACVQTKAGRPLEVRVATARIFFTEKNGHVISFSEVGRDRQQTLSAFYQPEITSGGAAAEIRQRIAGAGAGSEVIRALKQLPQIVRILTDQGAGPDLLRETVGSVHDAAVRRFVEMVLAEKGAPGVSFSFVSLGSSARHEMTLFSDQDNALVFSDVEADRLAEVRRGFLVMADEVCGRLRQAGYPYCPGGIMAANPRWCLSLSEWKRRFSEWIAEATPENILEMNVFLDLRCACGDEGLVRELREHIRKCSARNPEFFIHYAKNCLGYKAPLGLLGRIRTEKHGERKTINLKECLKPIETLARIYALRHGVDAPGTIDRLEELQRSAVLKERSCREIKYVFDYLWRLRFYNQIAENAELSADADELDMDRLTDVERDNLQSVLSRIPLFQSRLSYDFLGMQI